MARRTSIAAGSSVVWLQSVATVVVAGAALAIGAFTIAGIAGLAPTLDMPLTFGTTEIADGGLYVQIAVALLLVAVVSALPSGFRVLALERTHRDFTISMSDIADAYAVSHAADRNGAFQLSKEFDAVKERIHFLRDHPDLGNLEPEILEAAAQMSFASRELAQVYSAENVSRARGFLRHRQEEIEMFDQRIDSALAACRDLRRQLEMVEVEESAMESRLKAMEEEFGDMLEELGFARTRRGEGNVIALPNVTAAE